MNKTAKKRINDRYKLDGFEFAEATIQHQIPILHPEFFIPGRLVDFDSILRSNDFSAGVHTFLDDYKIDRLWNKTDYYIPTLKKFSCVFTPDFSLLLDMPECFISTNVFRSRRVGQILQKAGLRVIPTVGWAGRNTYDICFDGLPQKSVLAVSTVGVFQRRIAFQYFIDGLKEMLIRLSPSTLIIYGAIPALNFPLPDIVHFESTTLVWKKSYQPDLMMEVY